MKNNILIILAIIGILSSSYLTYSKYSSDNLCDINDFLSCDKVNTSEYSTFLNIPLSILSILYFIIILILTYNNYFNYIFYLSIPVLLFSLYLTYIELFVINALCVVCEFTKLIILSLIISVLIKKKNQFINFLVIFD